MADPVTATIGMGATMLGSAVGAFGNWYGGQAQGAMQDYRAAVALMNKKVAEDNARYALSAGEIEAEQAGMKARFQIGEAKAVQGASGLDVNSGSNARVREGMWQVAQQDMGIIRTNAAKTAYGYQVEAASQQAQSQLDRYAANYDRTAGTISAFGSLLGGAGKVSSQWMSASRAGVFA